MRHNVHKRRANYKKFDPLTLSPDLWLDIDDTSTITLNGSNVSRIDDKSGNDKYFVQSTALNQPPYLENSVNGRNTIQFNNNTHWITAEGRYIFSDTDGLSLVAVVKPTGTGDLNYFFDFGGATTDGYGAALSTDNARFYSPTNDGGAAPVIAGTYQSKPTLFTGIIEFNGNQDFYLDEVIKSSDPITVTRMTSLELSESSVRLTSTSPMTLGIQGKTFNASDRYFKGEFCELFIFRKVLSSDEIDKISNYLNKKWGI